MKAFLKRRWFLFSCLSFASLVAAGALILRRLPYYNTRTASNFSYDAVAQVQTGQPQSRVIEILGAPLFITVWPMESYRFPDRLATVNELETLARNHEVVLAFMYTQQIDQTRDYCDVRVRVLSGRVLDVVNDIYRE